MEINYNAMFTSAAQFDTLDYTRKTWRWLGPMSPMAGLVISIALFANDVGTVAGYGGVYTGDANVDAMFPTHTFRAPTTGEFGWDSSKVLFTANRILTNLYDLGVLPNGLYSFPRAMNQFGQLVGYSD